MLTELRYKEERKKKDKDRDRDEEDRYRGSNRHRKREERDMKNTTCGGTHRCRVEKKHTEEKGGGKGRNTRTCSRKPEAVVLAISATMTHGSNSSFQHINSIVSREISPRFPRSMVWMNERNARNTYM